MKQFYRAALAVVAAVVAVACAEEFEGIRIEPSADANLSPMTITVGGEDTRVNIADSQIGWTADDMICIFEGTSSSGTAAKTKREFRLVEGSIADGKASFSGEVTASQTAFYAIYPYDAVVERASGTAFNLTLPAEQRLGENNVSDNALLAIGYFDTDTAEGVTLQNIVGFLRVDISFDDVESVVVEGEDIAGKVKVTGKTAVVSGVSTASDMVTLLPAGEVFEPGSYYIALLPGTTPAGEFRITFNRTSKIITAYTATKDITIERNKGLFIADYKWAKGSCVIGDAATLAEFLANSTAYGKAEFACDIDLAGVTLPSAADFEGDLDCKGFSLKNWNATAPLFERLSGSVRNLVIDESCNLAPADRKGAFGFVAATVASGGALENITNNVATVCLDATAYGAGSSQLDDAVYFGTLAGECYGTMSGCVNNADITITTNPTGDDVRGMVYIGGLVGLHDAAELVADADGVVTMADCRNNGDINYTVASGRGGFLFMGGLVGGTTASKLSGATTIKAVIDNCANTGTISHIYPDDATALGAKTKDNSNYTYVAGVVGYCEGSVSNSVNGTQGDGSKGGVRLTTPALASGYVVANTSVAGVAGFALTAGATNANYAPIVVAGSFGSGTIGTSQLGGGAQSGVSVGGVFGQTGAGAYFDGYALSDCHNHGTLDVDFAMADDATTTLYLGGVVGYASTPIGDVTNNAAVTLVSSANNHSVGGVVGCGCCDILNATNNAELSYDLTSNDGNQLEGADNCFGGVVGTIPSASGVTIKGLTNCGRLLVTISGTAVVGGEIYVGGVVGKSLVAASELANHKDVTFTADDLTELYVGGLCGYGAGELNASANHATVAVSATSVAAEVGVGGILGTSGIIAMADCTNSGDIGATFSGSLTKAYAGGIVGYATGKITATRCINDADAITLSATSAELDELSVAGISGRSYAKSTYTDCENRASIDLRAKSAEVAHLAGIEGTPNSATIGSTNGATTDGCRNTGDLTANFPARWYVGGISSWGGPWTSTASAQMRATGNVVECDIAIDTPTLGHYVGGIIGFSGLHTEVTNNSYSGTISVGANSSAVRSFVGGIVGVDAVNQTSATSAKNGTFSFGGNVVNAELVCGDSDYVGLILGGVDNVSTKTAFDRLSTLTVNFDADNANRVADGCKVGDVVVTAANYADYVMGGYNDPERFTLKVNGKDSVVLE